MKIYHKEKIGAQRRVNILGLTFCYWNRKYKKNSKKLKKQYENNSFVKDLLNFHPVIPGSVLQDFAGHWDDIDKYFYQHLSDEDKKTTIRWFWKRFIGVDTVTKKEKEFLTEKFEKAAEIYRNRQSIEDEMVFYIDDKPVKFISAKQIVENDDNPAQILMNYYEVVHAFMLKEYQQQGFEPKDGGTILDCGAANGDTAILFKTLYPNSKVYSFECTEKNFLQCQRNVKLNGLKDVNVIHSFLNSYSGDAYLNRQKCRLEKTPSDTNVKVNAIAIDDFVKEQGLSDIQMIKFDIEGGEQEALKGCVETIKREKPMLAIPLYHLASDVYNIPKFLHGLGLPMDFSVKWTEKIWGGVDYVLFVRFK